MNYASEMDSGSTTYTPSFIKLGSAVKIDGRGDTQTHGMIS
jgi:hypothetical protein